MNIYLLERDATWDENMGFVVAAETPADARRVVAEAFDAPLGDERLIGGDEGKGAWTDQQLSTCKRLGAARVKLKRGIVMRSFKSG